MNGTERCNGKYPCYLQFYYVLCIETSKYRPFSHDFKTYESVLPYFVHNLIPFFPKSSPAELRCAKDSSSRVSDLLMAVGSYFIMVRARDLQGGEVRGVDVAEKLPAAGDFS